MTPEQIRRILDPEQRRKGHEAWKAEQRVRARGVPYVCEEGRKHPAAPPAVTSVPTDLGAFSYSRKELEAAAQQPMVPRVPYFAEMQLGYKPRAFWGQRSGKASASKSALRVRWDGQWDDAEADLRAALGELVAIDVAASAFRGHRPKVVAVQRCEASASHRVTLRSSTWPGDLSSATACTQNPDPTMASLDWMLCPASDEGEGCYEAEAQVSDEWALVRLRRTLGDECLAALQPKLEVRDAVATITRKTLRKDGGG